MHSDPVALDFDIRCVTVAGAQAWLRGEIHDSAMVQGTDIIFWNELGNVRSYRAALRQIQRQHAAGARAMIVHACNQAVWHKLEKEGCLCCLSERLTWRGESHAARRYLAQPGALARWLNKLKMGDAITLPVSQSSL